MIIQDLALLFRTERDLMMPEKREREEMDATRH
jgi:hypothetical protein